MPTTPIHPAAHQFVDHLSHEFRTPLTVIKEFSTILREGLVGLAAPGAPTLAGAQAGQ
jgi:signal transduction histidine kinase